MKEYETILDALDEHNRIMFCNKINQCMYIVDYDDYELINSLWWSKIFLYKNDMKCGEIVLGSYSEWFVDDNHQIYIIP